MRDPMRISEPPELRSLRSEALVDSLGRWESLVDTGEVDVPFRSDLKPSCCLT